MDVAGDPRFGTSTASAAGKWSVDFYRLHQVGALQVRPNLFAGGGLHFDNHADVHPDDDAEAYGHSPPITSSVANGLPLDTQISAGPSIEILWDSRDSFINPSRGWLARANYRALFDGFLGGDSSWEKVNLDLRTYTPLSSDRRHKLAAWAYRSGRRRGGALFDLPSTASDSTPIGTRLPRGTSGERNWRSSSSNTAVH